MSRQKYRFLIVEDNKDHRFLLKQVLMQSFSSPVVDECETSEEAKGKLSEYGYDAVLLDYRLRREEGSGILKWIRQNAPFLTVIMITNLEDVEVAVQALKMGANDFILKNEEGLKRLPHQIEKAITESNLKKKLHETELRYKTLVEHINEAIFLVNEKLEIEYVSPSIQKVIPLIGKGNDNINFLKYLSEAGREFAISNFKAVMEGKQKEPFIVQYISGDGEKRFLEINISPVKDNGKITGIVGTIQDVTVRKILEMQIESERRKFFDILSSMIDWVIIVDENYRVKFINHALEKVVGKNPGKRCYEIIFNKNKPCEFCKLEKVKKGYIVRWELRREDGKTFDIISSPFVDDEGGMGGIMILRDITRRKMAEETLKKKNEEVIRTNNELKDTINRLRNMQEKLVQSEKLAALGRLVSGVAHELNNPLFSAMGYTELLLMESSRDREHQEKLNRILESIRRAREIINDLLNFARRERMEMEELDINQVIRHTLSLKEYELRVDNIDLILNLGKNLPSIAGNFGRLQQVFLNILVNAQDAIKEKGKGGIIRIESGVIKEDKNKPSIFVSISNNGVKIPEENMKKIFDPFFTTKEVGKGTGLGLSTSYGIVREHEGHIDVMSDDNWTTFRIVLPVKRSMVDKKQPVEEAQDIDVKGKGEGILVVDDEQVIINLLSDFLSRKGFSVYSALSGDEALTKLGQPNLKVIISDVKMPGMDGTRLFEEIKKRRPELVNNLIFITGDTLSLETKKFLNKNKCYSLKKPFGLNELIEIVDKILNRPQKELIFE